MNSPKYRVFVCTKQRSANDPEGCCADAGASGIYQAFQSEIEKRQLGEQVEIRCSGCLDHCEAGPVALVYQPASNMFSWLPSKLRLKLKRLFMPNRCFYGYLNCQDIPAIVDSHFIQKQALKRCQIPTN